MNNEYENMSKETLIKYFEARCHYKDMMINSFKDNLIQTLQELNSLKETKKVADAQYNEIYEEKEDYRISLDKAVEQIELDKTSAKQLYDKHLIVTNEIESIRRENKDLLNLVGKLDIENEELKKNIRDFTIKASKLF